jgi:hypothetical protein
MRRLFSLRKPAMKKPPSFTIPRQSLKAVLTIFGVAVGILVVWKISSGNAKSASSRPMHSEARKLPDGPRLAVLKGSHGFSDRAAAVEYSTGYDRIMSLNGKEFDKALNALNARFRQNNRIFAFSRNCVVRLSKSAPIGKLHEGFVEDAEDNEASAIWVEEKYLMDTTSVLGSRILTGLYVFDGSESVEVDGVTISTLEEVLSALAEGQLSSEKAASCVLMPEAQGMVRIEAELKEHVIFERAKFQFAMRREKGGPLEGKPIRYVGHEAFTTKSGLVREIPVFESMPNIKRERVFDDSQFEAIRTN